MRATAIARPLEINETEKALRAAIKEILVCIYPDNPLFYFTQDLFLYFKLHCIFQHTYVLID